VEEEDGRRQRPVNQPEQRQRCGVLAADTAAPASLGQWQTFAGLQHAGRPWRAAGVTKYTWLRQGIVVRLLSCGILIQRQISSMHQTCRQRLSVIATTSGTKQPRLYHKHIDTSFRQHVKQASSLPLLAARFERAAVALLQVFEALYSIKVLHSVLHREPSRQLAPAVPSLIAAERCRSNCVMMTASRPPGVW
jgi:hypothetical protein